MAAALRLFGAVMVLLALVVPDLAAALVPELDVELTRALAERGDDRAEAEAEAYGEGGACGEDEVQEDLIDCGAELDPRFDEPLAISLLRSTEVLTTKRQCEELLRDIWSEQSCALSGRECGKLLPCAPPSPGPKLASSSSSARLRVAGLGLAGAPVERVDPPGDDRLPRPADLQPPVPPPKLQGC